MTKDEVLFFMASIIYLASSLSQSASRAEQDPLEHRRRGGDHGRTESDEDAHRDPARPVIRVAEHDEDLSSRDETDDGYRAVAHRPQRLHGRLREHPILPG